MPWESVHSVTVFCPNIHVGAMHAMGISKLCDSVLSHIGAMPWVGIGKLCVSVLYKIGAMLYGNQ